MDNVQLTIDGNPVGCCDAEIFELVKLYLADGKTEVEVARELKASGVAHAVIIVVNAKRELGLVRM